nr:uroporphyrinogen-III C-methyltransferase [Raineyella fluvialis]
MFEIDVAGRQVLITGLDATMAAHIAALLRDGAEVTVAAEELPTALKDLVQRGLITHDIAPEGSYDLVIAPRPVPADPAPATPGRGRVTLVGGGPGDPGLITVAGLRALREADVVVTDRLAPQECLAEIPPHAEVIDVAKIPRGEQTSQDTINEVLVAQARLGKHVVRFKGGDPYVFGRGGEEVIALTAAGIPVSVVPGVTSSIAAPELVGIPVTHRGLTQGFTVVSGHVAPDDPRSTLDWASLAHTGTTLVILMGVHTLRRICARLLADGMDPTTPAATIADAGLASQRVVRSTLGELPDAVAEASVGSPAVTVIGAVAGDELPGTNDLADRGWCDDRADPGWHPGGPHPGHPTGRPGSLCHLVARRAGDDARSSRR